MFDKIQDKEHYYIQPVVESEDLRINIKYDLKDKKIFINTWSSNGEGKGFHLSNDIVKELEESYSTSPYFMYEINLFGFVRTDKDRKMTLSLYDVIRADEFAGDKMTMRYNIRLQNLVARFLSLNAKYINVLYSGLYSEDTIKFFIDTFVRADKLNKVQFHKNCLWHDDDNEIIQEEIWTEHEVVIEDVLIGSFTKKEYDDNQNETSSQQLPCANGFLVRMEEGEAKMVALDKMLDKEKVSILESISEYKSHKAIIKEYNLLGCNGFIFSHLV